MSCQLPANTLSQKPQIAAQNDSDIALRRHLVEMLFQQSAGVWVLDRRLQTENATEPTGYCVGTVTLTSRAPSVFINSDGKLEQAVAEMVYHEQGHFSTHRSDLSSITSSFGFSRKYIWRLQPPDDIQSVPIFSIWFTKPGTDIIDYLFHKVSISLERSQIEGDSASTVQLRGDAGHLCEEDIYSSTYTFNYNMEHTVSSPITPSFELKDWTMLHEVRGPGKDQTIETQFIRR